MRMKIRICSSAGPLTCTRYSGWLGHEEKDAALWASWGVCSTLSKPFSI